MAAASCAREMLTASQAPHWRASIDVREIGFGEKVAQHVGDGDAALERRDLDAAAQFGRDVDRQSGGEGAVLRGGERGCLGDLIRLSTSPGREANWLRRGRSVMARPRSRMAGG